MVPIPLGDGVVLLWRHTVGHVQGKTWLGSHPNSCLFPQCGDVLAVMTFHPFLFCDLTLEPPLVGAFVEPLDSPMLKFSLFGECGEERRGEGRSSRTDLLY